MMNNDMMKMMMMSQMMGGSGDGDGSDGNSGGGDMGMLFKLLSGAQDEPQIESVWEDAVTFGTAKDRNGTDTIGVLEIRMIPGHADDPTPRIRIKSNDVIISRPEDLAKIATSFQRFVNDEVFHEEWELLNTEENLVAYKKLYDDKQSSNAISKLM